MGQKVCGAVEWQRKLAQLSTKCKNCGTGERKSLLRKIASTVCSPPPAFGRIGLRNLDRASFDKYVEEGAYESAAFQLIAPRMGYMVSKSPAGQQIATVSLPGLVDEFSLQADELCLSLAGAIAGAVSQIEVEPQNSMH